MSVEDTIRELVSTMPPEWQKKNMSELYIKN